MGISESGTIWQSLTVVTMSVFESTDFIHRSIPYSNSANPWGRLLRDLDAVLEAMQGKVCNT